MKAALITTTPEDLHARRVTALVALYDRFTLARIRERAALGTLCDCERDTWHELSEVEWLLHDPEITLSAGSPEPISDPHDPAVNPRA